MNKFRLASLCTSYCIFVYFSIAKHKRHRLKQFPLRKQTNYPIKDQGLKPYLKSKMTRYINGYPLIPIGFIKTRAALLPKNGVNKYTVSGRELIHKQQKSVPDWQVQWIRKHPVINERASIEFNDNRISLFIAQKGKCAVSGEKLILTEMDCHHKQLWSLTKDDRYSNLVLITRDIHRLIHATEIDTIRMYREYLKLNEEQMQKLNKLRVLVGNEEI